MYKYISEISRLKNNSRQAVQKFIVKNKIEPSGMKGKLPLYDTSKEPLSSYLNGKAAAAKPPPPEPPEPPGPTEPPATENTPPQNADTAVLKYIKPLNAILAGKIPGGQKPSSVFYAEAVSLAKKNQDAGLLFKLGQIADREDRDELYQLQMLKTEQAKEQIAQEKAARLKIENDIRREEYLDRATVKLLFGKTYAVHTSILIPLSLKLTPSLAAVPEGPEKEQTMRKMIDNEIYAALGSIRRLLADFVKDG